ncbi:MAG TPA: sulfite exporter TauE/SafE family protein [Azospira sp.]|nr:sulfite exporter TauE/SafE family protein [Azospira sp.]
MSVDLWWLAYVALGLFAGFMAGLLGIGGGAVMVPLLAMIFAAQQFPPEQMLHLALGTSMATIIFTAVSSLRAHHKHGAVMWETLWAFTPGVLVGTLIGTQIAARVSTRGLALFFALFISCVAVQMALNFKPKPHRELPGKGGLGLAGGIIGALSSLVAIGGGSLTVPYLAWCNVPVRRAIGTSAALGLPIAFFGTLGYIWNGWGEAALPAWSVGYVYLPALAWVMAGSVVAAPAGARLAHRLPVAALKRVFAGVLVLLAAKMLHGVIA